MKKELMSPFGYLGLGHLLADLQHVSHLLALLPARRRNMLKNRVVIIFFQIPWMSNVAGRSNNLYVHSFHKKHIPTADQKIETWDHLTSEQEALVGPCRSQSLQRGQCHHHHSLHH